MKFLFPIILLLVIALPASARDYTVQWDAVVGATGYMVCVDSVDPATLNPPPPQECAGAVAYPSTPTYVFSAANDATMWIRVRATKATWAGWNSWNVEWGQYSWTTACLNGLCQSFIRCTQ
jgi:hypothetical protein